MPSRRDTASWRIGLHRRTAPLRAIRRGEGLPSLAAAIAFAVGLVNLASALTPTIAWRHHLLLQLEPMEAVPVFHTLAVPASIALVVVAFYLRARRHRAWQVAIGLMLALAAIELLKGLDFEEAVLSLGAAGLLWWGRDAFYVRHRPLRPAPPAVIALVAVAAGCASLAAWAIGSDQLHDELAWEPLVVGGLGLAAILRSPSSSSGRSARRRSFPATRSAARRPSSSARTGRDTLAFFKLRRDAHYQFSGDGRAFLGYRVANGVMLVSGDPVGPDEALPGLVRESCAFAETRGLRIAALGASERVLGALPPGGHARALPRRRGDRRHADVLARGPGDPEGAPVGAPAGGGRVPRRGDRLRRARRPHPRGARARVCELARRRCPSGASRWRWTRCAAAHQAGSVVVAARDARRRDPRASSTSSRATAAPRCRCRSCAATARRRTA